MGASTVTRGEVDRRLADERRRERRKVRRWRLVALAVAAVVVGGAALLLYRGTRPAELLAPPSTALSSESPRGRWTTAGYDLSNSRYVPTAPEFEGRLKWRYQAGEPFFASPAATDDTVYAPTGGGRIVALDATTGAVRWERTVGAPSDSTPAIAGDALYVGVRDGRLLALEQSTGVTRWEYEAGSSIISAVVVSGGELYFGSSDGRLHALDAATGRLRWRSRTAKEAVERAPAVVGDHVIVTIGSGARMFDTRTGEMVIEYDLVGIVTADPVVSGDELYLGDFGGLLRAIDLSWRRPWWDRGPVRSMWEQLWVWNMAPLPPSEVLWVRKFRGGPLGHLAVTDDVIYFGLFGGRLVAVDRSSHDTLWEYPLAVGSRGAAVVAGDTVYIGANDGSFHAVNAETGEMRWRFVGGGRIEASATITDNGIYITGGDGALYALE